MPDNSLRRWLERLFATTEESADSAPLPISAGNARASNHGGEVTQRIAEALLAAKAKRRTGPPTPPSVHDYDCPLPVDRMPMVSPDPGDGGIELIPPDVDQRMRLYRRPIPPFAPYLRDSAGWHVEGCGPDGRRIWPGDRV